MLFFLNACERVTNWNDLRKLEQSVFTNCTECQPTTAGWSLIDESFFNLTALIISGFVFILSVYFFMEMLATLHY